MDALFVNADDPRASYQDLAETYSAVEPPTWSLLLAQSCRAKGFNVEILDPVAERLGREATVQRIVETAPKLVVFVVYGQNPNSGTTNMTGNLACAQDLKDAWPQATVAFVGSHTSALPREVLANRCVDIVLLNEGVYALHSLLATDLSSDLPKVKGIGYKVDGNLVLNRPERVVPNELMDQDLPGYAWDLLPRKERPLDLYRSHFWHAGYSHEARTPFAAIYTSLGCRFKCDFCMINIVNRTDNGERVVASDSAIMRHWSPEFTLGVIEDLAAMGVSRLRLSDEMFFLNQRYFEPLLQGIVERDLDLHMWSYTRVDTVRERYLELFRKAGIEWLGVGVEAGNREIRREVSKGTFKVADISEVVGLMQSYDLNVGANYIFGFPEDTHETMRETLDLAKELVTEFANFYPAQALPGSSLHNMALDEGWELPKDFEGYGFLSYDAQPLPTRHLSAAEVLAFRDEAWHEYFSHEPYLDLIERKFGVDQRRNVEELSTIRLRRRLNAT